eukprot:Skav236593  [mRNA]  locus=scaffold415:104451:105550:+ [translate_table: standard]
MFGMGCFWCSENIFMRVPGVYSTQVGYAGGDIENPSYNDVCTGIYYYTERQRQLAEATKERLKLGEKQKQFRSFSKFFEVGSFEK